MAISTSAHGRMRRNRWLSFCAAIGLLQLTVAGPLLAQGLYLRAGQIDGIGLLPPPPPPGSAEEAADLSSARSVFQGRTPELEARATKSSALSMFLFRPAIADWFQAGKLPKTEALFDHVKKEIGKIIDEPKDHWKRRRPYQLDPQLSLGKPEASASYPSGHSTRGTVYSLMFAEIFPEKKEGILAIGRSIGWDRVLIGKHFPTDVFAGRVLGQAIFHELLKSPEFQQELAQAKAEVQAMQSQ